MRSSLTYGPYESAVSMKFTPSSGSRRSTRSASSRSAGSPHTPLPVIRIAPKPRRLTVRSPPRSKVPLSVAVGAVMKVSGVLRNVRAPRLRTTRTPRSKSEELREVRSARLRVKCSWRSAGRLPHDHRPHDLHRVSVLSEQLRQDAIGAAIGMYQDARLLRGGDQLLAHHAVHRVTVLRAERVEQPRALVVGRHVEHVHPEHLRGRERHGDRPRQ